MTGIACQMCTWQRKARSTNDLGLLAGLYMFHCVTTHWDLIKTMHDRPDLAAEAAALIEGDLR